MTSRDDKLVQKCTVSARPMLRRLVVLTLSAVATVSVLVAARAGAHGNVTPQAVDTSALPQLGLEWRPTNPYLGNEKAIEIGASAYNQNCARCHGLEGISGGIAPDLRYLTDSAEDDEWFMERFRNGSTRDGKVYMPAFEEALGQEAGWAIRTYLLSLPEPE